LSQAANAWSQFSAVRGSTWLKQFENEEILRLNSRKNAFDGVPISSLFSLKSESSSSQRSLEVLSAID